MLVTLEIDEKANARLISAAAAHRMTLSEALALLARVEEAEIARLRLEQAQVRCIFASVSAGPDNQPPWPKGGVPASPPLPWRKP
jgi:hypothetical protein